MLLIFMVLLLLFLLLLTCVLFLFLLYYLLNAISLLNLLSLFYLLLMFECASSLIVDCPQTICYEFYNSNNTKTYFPITTSVTLGLLHFHFRTILYFVHTKEGTNKTLNKALSSTCVTPDNYYIHFFFFVA